ncbi:MAG: hypothetical protein WCE44_10195 [Candidatus Velthaea sp.]
MCPAIALAPPPLLYPQSGATGIPPGNLVIVLGWAFGTSLTLTAGNGATVATGSTIPAPLPLPSSAATPSPGFTPVAYPVPSLQPITTYTIGGSVSFGEGCPTQSATFGSFTTSS